MGKLIHLGPSRPTAKDSKRLADKLQILILRWPDAGHIVEQFVDKLLTELDRSR